MGRVVLGDDAPVIQGVANLSWLSKGLNDWCTLCNLHVGHATYKIRSAPVCKKCYDAYEKLLFRQLSRNCVKLTKVLAAADTKIEEYLSKPDSTEVCEDATLEYATSNWCKK